MAIVRQFTQDPTQETLLEIEAINVVDIAPPAPGTGVGSGNLLEVGEHEDGPFAAGGDSAAYDENRRGVLECFSPVDVEQKFGGFGFQRFGIPSNDPCARIGAQELWNGNGFLKLRSARMNRLFIGRVDSNVGEVQFQPLATVRATVRGPFVLGVGAWLSVDADAIGPVAATSIAATAAGLDANIPPAAILTGDAISITMDGGAPVQIIFDGSSSAIADVVNVINAAMGAIVASDNGGAVRLTGQRLGTMGSLDVVDVVAGSGARIGFNAPALPQSVAGTGNVGDTNAITAAELAPLAAAIPSLVARVDADGFLVLSAVTSVLVSAGTAQALLGLPTVIATLADNPAGVIPAGTRVTDGTTVWVTLQTLNMSAGQTTTVLGKVRPALEDGLALGALALAINVVTDYPTFADVIVSNPLAVSVALTDPQKDVRYQEALDATLGIDALTNPSKNADYLLMARRTDSMVRAGRQNVLDATESGLRNRKFLTRAPLGFSPDQAIADVALNRSDRVFSTYPGVKVLIPEIAARGSAGGLGFTDNGVITVGADNPLATLCCRLNPEQNPAESGTGLIQYILGQEDMGRSLTVGDLKAFKAAGISAPVFDEDTGWEFQSGITTSLTSGRTTMARRRMADFLQDSYKIQVKPFQKKINRPRERNAAADRVESFMSGLAPENTEDLQRVQAYSVDRTSGNTPDRLALGIYVILVVCRIFSSLDAIVVRTEIGENAIVTTDGES